MSIRCALGLSLSLSFLAVAGAGEAQVHLILFGLKSRFASQGTKQGGPEAPELTRIGLLWDDAVHAGVAYKKGELAQAESRFLQARSYEDLYPRLKGVGSALAGWLARIYSIQGRQAEPIASFTRSFTRQPAAFRLSRRTRGCFSITATCAAHGEMRMRQ
jgi:hypothetical protein